MLLADRASTSTFYRERPAVESIPTRAACFDGGSIVGMIVITVTKWLLQWSYCAAIISKSVAKTWML